MEFLYADGDDYYFMNPENYEQTMLKGSSITVQLSTQADGMAGPLANTLQGFATQYERAVRAQQGR